MRLSSLATVLMAGMLASVLLAAPAASAEEPPKSGTVEPPATTAPKDEERRRRTPEEAMADCMAMWEPATHMTKAQWARVCKRNSSSY